ATGRGSPTPFAIPAGAAHIVFSPDGTRIAAAGEDAVAGIDTQSGRELYVLREHTSRVSTGAWGADGRTLLTATTGQFGVSSIPGQLKLWRASDGQVVHELKGHNAGIAGAAFHPDGTRVLSSSGDGTVKLWDTVSGQEILSLRLQVKEAHFDPRGERLAVL